MSIVFVSGALPYLMVRYLSQILQGNQETFVPQGLMGHELEEKDARGYLGSGPPSVTYVRLTEALLTNLPFDPDNTPLQKTEFIGIIVCCC